MLHQDAIEQQQQQQQSHPLMMSESTGEYEDDMHDSLLTASLRNNATTTTSISPTRTPTTTKTTTTTTNTTERKPTSSYYENDDYKSGEQQQQYLKPSLTAPLPPQASQPSIVTTWERSPFFRDLVHEREHPNLHWIEPPNTPLFLTPWYQKALLREPWFITMCSMFIPGSGHALIGQNTKAIFYMTTFYTLLVTCVSLSLIYVGLFTLPLVALAYGVIVIDAHYMALRLFRYSHAIMQGECAYGISTWGLRLVLDKVFVSGDMMNAPDEYVNRMNEQYGTA